MGSSLSQRVESDQKEEKDMGNISTRNTTGYTHAAGS